MPVCAQCGDHIWAEQVLHHHQRRRGHRQMSVCAQCGDHAWAEQVLHHQQRRRGHQHVRVRPSLYHSTNKSEQQVVQ